MDCVHCHDSGFKADGSFCSCRAGQAADRADQFEDVLPYRLREYRFESFPAHTKALRAAREKVEAWCERLESGVLDAWLLLLLSIEPGRGKTGLATSAAHRLTSEGRVATPKFLSTSRWFAAMQDRMDGYRDVEVESVNELIDCDLLVLDDVGVEQSSEWVRRKYDTVLSARHAAMDPTIITTNLSLEDLVAHVGGRQGSRFGQDALILPLDSLPDLRRTLHAVPKPAKATS